MTSGIDILISDTKIWNDAIVLAWICEDSLCDAYQVTKNSASFMVIGEEEDMIAAIRAVEFTDLDAEDSPILSYRFDESEIAISASCQDYQAELPCIIDTLIFDYDDGVMVGVSKYNQQATVLPADVEIVHGEVQEAESKDEDDVAEDLEDLEEELEDALEDLEEELEDALEDALEDVADVADDAEPSDEARRLQDEEPAEEVTAQEGDEDVEDVEGEEDAGDGETEDVAEEGAEEAGEAEEAWAPGARRVGMAVLNQSTQTGETFGQVEQREIILEGEGSIYTELTSSVNAAVEEAKEAKIAAEEEAEGGQVDEDEDEDEDGDDDGSISLATTFGALAIAVAALAF